MESDFLETSFFVGFHSMVHLFLSSHIFSLSFTSFLSSFLHASPDPVLSPCSVPWGFFLRWNLLCLLEDSEIIVSTPNGQAPLQFPVSGYLLNINFNSSSLKLNLSFTQWHTTRLQKRRKFYPLQQYGWT